MKKLLFALPIIAIASNATAGEISPYISLKLGLGSSSWENASVEPSGGGVIGAIGAVYEMEEVNLRGEIEASYILMSDSVTIDDFPLDSTSITTDQNFTSYMANFYVDFLQSYRIKPYVGIGLGIMGLKEDMSMNIYDYITDTNYTIDATAKETAVAYGFNGGFGFNFTNSLAGDFGIKYTIGAFENININVFTTAFGIRYKF